jgi:hypothetical protein
MAQLEPLDCKVCREFKASKVQLEALGRKEYKVLLALVLRGQLELEHREPRGLLALLVLVEVQLEQEQMLSFGRMVKQ